MKKFVVAFINFYDHVMTQEVIEAESEFAAIVAKMGDTPYGDEQTVEDLKMLAFDCDCMVSAFEI